MAASACATSKDFTPSERATAISPEGYTAADYDMIVEGERLGDARIWSEGAHRSDAYDDRTVLHVGMRIENAAEEPLEIDPEEIDVQVGADRRTVTNRGADFADGPRTIAAGEEETLDLYFLMPRGVSPGDVDDFQVTWTASAPDGLAYTQRTPFLQNRAYSRPYYDYPYGSAYLGTGFYYSPFDPFYGYYSPYYRPYYRPFYRPYYRPYYRPDYRAYRPSRPSSPPSARHYQPTPQARHYYPRRGGD